MKIVLPPVYERNNDPDIDGEGDFFQRRAFADNLTRLFKACDESLVISIDSKWGDGKTSFVKGWVAELECGVDFIPIYYDAYKSDFTNDAFLSIATAIHEKLRSKKAAERRRINKKQIEALRESMATVAVDMLKLGAGVAVTNLTGGLVSGKDVSERVGGNIGKVLSDGLKGRVEQKLKAHADAQNHINDYRERLKQALEASGGKKIIFFIDELDRCRPDFSIQVIEKIKHLFDVAGVFFVLAVNRRQLLSVITHAYGVSAVDAEIYFQKFIHLEARLPSISRAIQRDKQSLERFVTSVFKSHEFDLGRVKEGVKEFIELIGPNHLSLSPRAIERVATLVSIVLVLAKDDSANGFYLLVLTSAAIMIGDPDYYYKYYSRCTFRTNNVSDYEAGKYYNALRPIFQLVHPLPAEGHTFSAPYLREILDLVEIFDFPEPPWASELDD